jgi:hypothetical protein
MAHEALLDIWQIDGVAACKDGMALANAFLESCIVALNAGSSTNFNARFETFRRHKSECDKCTHI